MSSSANRLRAAVAVLIGVASSLAPAAEPATITIDTSVRHQTIDGFGASGCWTPNWLDGISRDNQDRALDLLFTDAGAGLTIYRHNLPSAAGEDVLTRARRSANVETAPFEYDISRDEKNIDLLRRVMARGVDDVVLFSISPPRRLTRNGKTSGGDAGRSNLIEGAEAGYARYLIDVSLLTLDEVGLASARLSPVNEPNWFWGEHDERRWQEGCHYTPEEVRRVGRAVLAEVDSRDEGDRLHLDLFDAGSWASTPEYAGVIWSDPVLRASLDAISIHSYWSGAAERRQTRAWLDEHMPGVKVVMSEFCEMRGGHDPTMQSGLVVAQTMHEDFTIGRVTEWTWWLGLSRSQFCDGLVHCWLERDQIDTTKRLWVIAQWSRFVHRGWSRVEIAEWPDDRADRDDLDGLMASAFASPDGSERVCVIVNTADAPRQVRTLLKGGTGPMAAPITAWITDDQRDLARLDWAGVVPPRSVVTLEFDTPE